MGKIVMVKSAAAKGSHTLVFSNATVDEIADKAAVFLGARGYSLESGSKTQGVYGRGMKGAQMLVGFLSKRAKFNLTVGKDGSDIALVVAKGMSGISGGLIAASHETKELEAIVAGLQSAILA